MKTYAPTAAMELWTAVWPTSQVGTLGVRINDNGANGGVDTTARTTAGITFDGTRKRHQIDSLVAPSQAGEYTIIWDNAGSFAYEDLIVTTSAGSVALPTGRDLCTVADVRTALETQPGITSRDALFQDVITDASELFHAYAEREFVTDPSLGSTRRVPVDLSDWGGESGVLVDLNPWDAQTVSAIVLHPESNSPVTLSAASDYQLEPVSKKWGVYNRIRLSSYLSHSSYNQYRFGNGLVDVTGTWGFPTIPRPVRRACIRTVAGWVNREAPNLAAASADNAQLAQAIRDRGYALPLFAKTILDDFKRMGI